MLGGKTKKIPHCETRLGVLSSEVARSGDGCGFSDRGVGPVAIVRCGSARVVTPRSWNQATALRKTSTAVSSGRVVPDLDAGDAGVVIDHGAPGHVTTFGRAWDGPVVLDDQPSELGA